MNKTDNQTMCIAKEINNLEEIEQTINAVIREFQITKKRLCLLLAQIKINRLYKQIALQSFKEYVLSKRLNISYNTALEYAKIGELLLKYKNQLAEADFSEEDGLKKLLLLEQALSNHEPEKVFKRIKDDSFKAFVKFSKPAHASFGPELFKPDNQVDTPEPSHKDSKTGQWIFEENGKLYMETKSQGFELLTFNKWFLEDEELASEYKLFMTNMIVAAMDYFKDTKRKRGLYKL